MWNLPQLGIKPVSPALAGGFLSTVPPGKSFLLLLLLFSQSCPTLCDPMDWSMPSFPVLHCLPEFVQTHVHWVCDAIQPTCPVIPFSYCLQSFPASGSFPVSRLFASGGQSIGASVLASVLPMNIQGWFLLGLTVLIFLLSKGLSRVLQHHSSKAPILWHSASFMVQLSHLYMTTRKRIALTMWTFIDQVMSLLFNTLYRFNTLS